ncbi:MAG: SCO family protein [Methylococcaceae bacterium]
MHDGLFGMRDMKFARTMLCVALTLVLNGCDTERQWQLHNIAGHLPDLRFSLMSDAGQPVTDQTYRGYLVMLFFGFTSCQAECPSTLFRLAKIAQGLGDNAKLARILFVTLDPGRDTPQALQRYVSAFAAGHAIGLTGSESEIADLAKRYRTAYRPRKSASGDITHSAAVYVFDPQGHARLLLTPDDAIETAANDLRHLLETSR